MKKQRLEELSPRALVLCVLGVITLGVAALSVRVAYEILVPVFGVWSVPTVAAVDALWVVLQATEIIAANNVQRARRVRWAGAVLTGVIAAIPTAHVAVTAVRGVGGGTGLAVILAPVAILATKTAWWLILPALGRRISAETRQALAVRRQEVADRMETMEADAAHRIELLTLATGLETQVGQAQTAYRLATLAAQQSMTEQLHTQATATEKTIAKRPLPVGVAHIALPELDTWTPTAPALPVTAVMQVSGSGRDGGVTASRARLLVTVQEIAAVTGVPTPPPGEQLTDAQMRVVLRALRYSDDPPTSYRSAGVAYRAAGFVGSEHRIRPLWRELEADSGESAEESEEDAEDPHRQHPRD
ncbi:hypothetical protein ABZX93_35120 [Streptomyces sp. NPDC006632]|uniref:hypothetical protein n=1 Tax=Streptomyces sp. NPDC006632 TaxID=3157182 RepID=UPI0033A1F80A